MILLNRLPCIESKLNINYNTHTFIRYFNIILMKLYTKKKNVHCQKQF